MVVMFVMCAGVLLLVGAATASASGRAESAVEVEIPEDERDEYLVGFQVFSGG
ncbi:MAG: hypothetical protein GVY14_13835, partial [Spirochaetes bacterium]|nr:hypothetical protein [Spirochaetota bacterium]